MMKKPLYIIAGPTAAGKSALAVEACQKAGWGDHIRRFHAGLPRHEYRHGQDPAGGDAGDSPSSDRLRGPMGRVECRAVYRAGTADRPRRNGGESRSLRAGTGFYLHALAYGAEFTSEETEGSCRRKLEETAAAEGGPQELLSSSHGSGSRGGGTDSSQQCQACDPRVGVLLTDRDTGSASIMMSKSKKKARMSCITMCCPWIERDCMNGSTAV